MSFLAPLFLLGGLVIALPIIFHLIRRTPVLQRRFSSLMFLNPSPPQLSRRSRLDKILLLLLRCGVVALLALAFARPFLQRKLPVSPSAGPVKVSVVLVDSSASMRRGNLWADATARARDVAQRAAISDKVQIAVFDRGVRKLVGFEEWSAWSPAERVSAATTRLSQTGPSWFGNDLGAGLIFAAEELDITRQEHPDALRQIVVISDLQEGSRFQSLQGYEWPRGIEVVFERVGGAARANAGLHPATEVESSSATKDERASVRVSNASDSKREQFRLTWINAQNAAPVGNSIDVYVPAGKTRVVAAPKRPEGAAEARLVLSGDDDPFDNTLHVGVAEPDRVRVLYAGTAAEDDPEDLLYFLKRAFQETRLQSVTMGLLRPGASWTIPPEVRFLVLSGEVAPAEAQILRKFMEEGGTALCVLKTARSVATLERLVNVQGIGAAEASLKDYAILEQIDFAHPVFAPFAEPRFSDFTRIHFWKHRRLETNALPATRVLAAFDNGAPALMETTMGKGTLLTLTCGWHPADSQLALSSKFVPLLYSMLEHGGAFKQRISLYFVGAEIAARSPSMSVQGPGGVRIDAQNGRWVSDAPGLYTIQDGATSYRIAVNLDPAESRTAPLEVEEFEKLGVPIRSAPVKTAATIQKEHRVAQAIELEGRQRLWRWFVVAALVILLIETWFAARLSRPTRVEA
ncbi:MAG: BatA domain-containing protein [Verrucomicrobia subdivision 3 bacterium]|nr:BatA domain-containing protein [Limisphaerales bacterium]